MKTILLCAALMFAAVAMAAGQPKVELTVRVSGIGSSEGKMMVGVYNKKETAFKKNAYFDGAIVPAQKGTMTFRFHLPPGKYAVIAVQDKNCNGDIDKNGLGIPKEPYGISGGIIRPVFDDAAFMLNAPKTIDIKLR